MDTGGVKGLREDMFRAVAAHARAPLRVRALATRNGVAARWAELADPSAIASDDMTPG